MHANGIRFHCVEEGSGPLVLLLHGFPDLWRSWRRQVAPLAAGGYRVVAADLRGYGESERPAGVAQYRLDVLADDAAALLGALGGGRPTLVGHDWGGAIAWQVAMRRPEALGSLVVVNAPHPAAFRRELRRPSRQVLRSWYAAFFQLPVLPEALLSAGGFALLKRALRHGPARGGEELDAYLHAFSRPGALSAALHYYRAAVRHPPRRPVPTRVPTLLVWGERDPFLVPALAEGLERWVEALEVARVPEAGHWPHLTHADRVNRRILAFLAAHAGRGEGGPDAQAGSR